ncbi:MAG: DUF5683 domain-containing protein [Bacteroidetes bacterium]|nr:DUF5683 domain-containing protein [Bacteroidota bacterium]
MPAPRSTALLALVGLLSLVPPAASGQLIQADSLFLVPRSDHSPRGALWRSAAVPGWGQLYNGQRIKLPFIYAALGVLGYQAWSAHDDYVLYREAYQYKAWQELVDAGQQESNPKAAFQPAYDQLAGTFGAISSRPLRTQRNNFRRSRDFSLIGVGLVYGLAMLDAYVSAHLLDFDVGENLSLQVSPGPEGLGVSARIHLGASERGGSSLR